MDILLEGMMNTWWRHDEDMMKTWWRHDEGECLPVCLSELLFTVLLSSQLLCKTVTLLTSPLSFSLHTATGFLGVKGSNKVFAAVAPLGYWLCCPTVAGSDANWSCGPNNRPSLPLPITKLDCVSCRHHQVGTTTLSHKLTRESGSSWMIRWSKVEDNHCSPWTKCPNCSIIWFIVGAQRSLEDNGWLASGPTLK